jgi:hypothetical protein
MDRDYLLEIGEMYHGALEEKENEVDQLTHELVSAHEFLKSTQIALRESESRVEQLLEESSWVSTTSISVESQSYASTMLLEDDGDLESFQAFAERHDSEAFDYAHVFQEPFLLEIPLKAQFMIIVETTEQIPCGSTNREVYASRDYGDGYITDEDTSIWDPGSTNTSIVSDTVART